MTITAEVHGTNAERSLRMKKRLLEATLACLAEKGYAATSTTEVVRRAGVSRGALAHHFANKAELVAEAAAYLINKRIRDTNDKMRAINVSEHSMSDRLRLTWETYDKWFPATIEFMVAARTDPDLRQRFSDAIDQYSDDLTSDTVEAWPEFKSDRAMLTQYVMGCFVRGLCLERIVNSDELLEQIFERFAELLELATMNANPK